MCRGIFLSDPVLAYCVSGVIQGRVPECSGYLRMSRGGIFFSSKLTPEPPLLLDSASAFELVLFGRLCMECFGAGMAAGSEHLSGDESEGEGEDDVLKFHGLTLPIGARHGGTENDWMFRADVAVVTVACGGDCRSGDTILVTFAAC